MTHEEIMQMLVKERKMGTPLGVGIDFHIRVQRPFCVHPIGNDPCDVIDFNERVTITQELLDEIENRIFDETVRSTGCKLGRPS